MTCVIAVPSFSRVRRQEAQREELEDYSQRGAFDEDEAGEGYDDAGQAAFSDAEEEGEDEGEAHEKVVKKAKATKKKSRKQ